MSFNATAAAAALFAPLRPPASARFEALRLFDDDYARLWGNIETAVVAEAVRLRERREKPAGRPTTIRLRESVFTKPAGRVDAARGLVTGVKVLGLKSRNGREYTREAVRKALPLIEGAVVYINHPAEVGDPRSYHERFGRLRNARLDAAGNVWADLRYKTAHPDAASFAWDCEHDPDGIGLSLNGDGEGRKLPGGITRVEAITKVYSFDIVDGPATNAGLFR